MGSILGKAKKGVSYLKHYGLRDFTIRLMEKKREAQMPYAAWFESHRVSGQELTVQRAQAAEWSNALKISIVTPLYHTPEKFLREMIASVQAQSYENWELCLADGSSDDAAEKIVAEYRAADARIRYRKLPENLGIAGNTNAAIAMADGDWLAFLDHDDLLEPDALFEAAVLSCSMQYDMIYTDEDKVDADGTGYFSPHFKPDINIDLLRANNYITHFLLVRREIAKKAGNIRREYEGAQDHDFILRCVEESANIGHIPKILYHWRCHKASTADNPLSKQYAVDAGRRAVADHLKRMGIAAEVYPQKHMGFYLVSYPVADEPLVSVCLWGCKNEAEFEKNAARIQKSIARKKQAGYRLEFIREKDLAKGQEGTGEYLLFLQKDAIPLEENWLDALLGVCGRKGTGIAGAKLTMKKNPCAVEKIFHAGMVAGVGPDAAVSNVYEGMWAAYSGYMHRASLQMDYSAVSGFCMLIKKSVYVEVGGMAEWLSMPYRTVDFCFRVRKFGYLVVYEPQARLRLPEACQNQIYAADQKKMQEDIAYIRSHWSSLFLQGDPYYNPAFSRERADYSL